MALIEITASFSQIMRLMFREGDISTLTGKTTRNPDQTDEARKEARKNQIYHDIKRCLYLSDVDDDSKAVIKQLVDLLLEQFPDVHYTQGYPDGRFWSDILYKTKSDFFPYRILDADTPVVTTDAKPDVGAGSSARYNNQLVVSFAFLADHEKYGKVPSSAVVFCRKGALDLFMMVVTVGVNLPEKERKVTVIVPHHFYPDIKVLEQMKAEFNAHLTADIEEAASQAQVEVAAAAEPVIEVAQSVFPFGYEIHDSLTDYDSWLRITQSPVAAELFAYFLFDGTVNPLAMQKFSQIRYKPESAVPMHNIELGEEAQYAPTVLHKSDLLSALLEYQAAHIDKVGEALETELGETSKKFDKAFLRDVNNLLHRRLFAAAPQFTKLTLLQQLKELCLNASQYATKPHHAQRAIRLLSIYYPAYVNLCSSAAIDGSEIDAKNQLILKRVVAALKEKLPWVMEIYDESYARLVENSDSVYASNIYRLFTPKTPEPARRPVAGAKGEATENGHAGAETGEAAAAPGGGSVSDGGPGSPTLRRGSGEASEA